MQKNKFILQAIELSKKSLDFYCGGPFGAVVVKDEVVIGQGWNTVVSDNDPTAHAEINAIRMACQKINSYSLDGAIIYTSCEPCPMCLASIYWSRIDKIIYGATHKDASEIDFDDSFIYREIRKNSSQRQITMIQEERERALEVFGLWMKKANRVAY